MKTFSVVICAFNEEKNIGAILQDVLNQELPKSFSLEKIVIVSDGSNDKTDKIVDNFTKKDSRLILIRNSERRGKAESFNIGKKYISSDFLISVDADIILEKNIFLNVLPNLEGMNNVNIDLVSVHAKPKVSKKYNITTMASMGTYFLVQDLIKNNSNSINGCRGIFLVLSRKFYKKIKLPDAPGTDMFMYFYCKKNDFRYRYLVSATVYYYPPSIFKDYLKQNNRAIMSKKFYSEIFNFNDLSETGFYTSFFIFFKNFIFHPFLLSSWFVLFSISCIILLFKKPKLVSGKWAIADSTKNKKHQ